MAELVLIVDDDGDLVSFLTRTLHGEGYRTTVAGDGASALTKALDPHDRPALILLDVVLPDIPGLEVCRKLRAAAETRDTPVLMLSARGEEADRVTGFEVGADDYVVKPFSIRELLLRVNALLRRLAHTPPVSDAKAIPGLLELDRPAHRTWVNGNEILLTPIEFRLLDTLISRRGRVQSRETLLETVWGVQADVQTRTVDAHIKRLREKLGAAGPYVETLRGIGYRFRPAGNPPGSA
ncbi:MAG: response regulator transcription factor [Magnetococcales bacterium]|nr:response regulator transcription factor [Magnetococcales bacterium]MBF0156572.1 response regulator transcription factor [Magnetococcales bacterium]